MIKQMNSLTNEGNKLLNEMIINNLLLVWGSSNTNWPKHNRTETKTDRTINNLLLESKLKLREVKVKQDFTHQLHEKLH